MMAEQLHDALNLLDDRFLEEARESREQTRPRRPAEK